MKTYEVWNGKERKQITKGIKAVNLVTGVEYIFESLDELKKWYKETGFDLDMFILKAFDNNEYSDESEF